MMTRSKRARVWLVYALWLVACLLLSLPSLSRADAQAAAATKAAICTSCHGIGGNSTTGDYPSLAGQTSRYLYFQLRDFKAGRRNDPRMSPMAANLTPEDMHALADYFAAQKPIATDFKADPVKVEAGRKKSEEIL
jgi:cytochrome c553